MILWLFEFGYVLQHMAVLFLVKSINSKKTTEGISIETLYFFTIGSLSRMLWMWDSMLANFYIAYIEVLLGLSVLGYTIYLYNNYKQNDYVLADFKMPPYLSFPVLLVIILIMSFLFHPGNKNSYFFTIQMFVSLNIYSECIGLLPQLYLIYNKKDTGIISDNYVVFLAIARFLRLVFWFKMYIDGNSFFSLILADLIHTILLGYFIYSYKKNSSIFEMPTFMSDDSNEKRKKVF
jgi:uncharacterized protein with PQ loop repeat